MKEKIISIILLMILLIPSGHASGISENRFRAIAPSFLEWFSNDLSEFSGMKSAGIPKTEPGIDSAFLSYAEALSGQEPVGSFQTFSKTETGLIRDIDGMPMVYIPEGEFTMGIDRETVGGSDEWSVPAHNVYLDSYWIDQYEITNRQYQKCVAEQACEKPPVYDIANEYYEEKQYENYPVTTIFWEQAKVYCEWVGASLPTEAQWEKAARGIDGRKYPWGDDYEFEDRANHCNGDKCLFPDPCNDGFEFTAPVGSYQKGASPYDVFDMTGNVDEWVIDWFAEDYYKNSPDKNPQGPENGTYHGLRGGSWGDSHETLQIWRRSWSSGTDNEIGFRCVMPVTDANARHLPEDQPELKNQDEIEIEAAKKVFQALYGCFKSYVFDTLNPDEFNTANGNKIRLLEQDKPQLSKKLSEADKANGVVWENFTGLKTLVYHNLYNTGWEWHDVNLFTRYYRYYEDGTIRTLVFKSAVQPGEWIEYGAKCYMDDLEAMMLYK